MKMTDEQMIEVGDFVTICTNGNDFLGDKSMFDGMVGEVLEINGAIKPVYKVRVIIESLFSDRELFCQKKGNADNDELKSRMMSSSIQRTTRRASSAWITSRATNSTTRGAISSST